MKEDEIKAPVKRKASFVEDEQETFNKPKLRRVEKKLAPVVHKLTTDELMKTNTYIRFNSYMDKVFEQLEDTEVISMEDNDENLECISSSLLANISAEAAKLKARASIDAIPERKLTLLITYAMRSILSAKNFSAGPDLSDDFVAEDCLEKILNAIEAALLICNIYTSKDTKFLQEDNIDTIIKFVQFQLRETIFPSYDPVYTIETKKKSEKAQNKKKQSNQQKGITALYTKIVELTKLLVRLFNKFHFVDTIIIHASSLGVEPFFVDNIETLQFVCLDLVTSVRQIAFPIQRFC
jgi:cohesin loading factor subunit SCC2